MTREDTFIAVGMIRNSSNMIWNRRPKVHISRKRMNENSLYNKIKELFLLSYYDGINIVDAENIALELKARLGQVRKIFMRLNREGILSHKKRRFAHDTNRNRMFYGRASGWSSNYYVISDRIKEIENE